MDVSSAAAGNNALFHGRTGCVQGIFHAQLVFLHLGLGGSTDADNRYAAGQLCQTLLQFFLIVIRGGLFHLGLDLCHAGLDFGGIPQTVHDHGIFLADLDRFRTAQLINGSILQFIAQFGTDDGAAGQGRDIL